MNRNQKVILIVSLLLNLCLIVGFVFFRNYVRMQNFRLAEMVAQSETQQMQSILQDIESDDPAKIAALKERLHMYIEQGKDASLIWRRAAGEH